MNERFEELVTGIVSPLVLGGKLRLARPFGPAALTVGQNERILDPDTRTTLDVARVRRARLLAPVDVLPELRPADWAIAAVLNDLLQVTNHNLGGIFTRRRHDILLASVIDACERIAAPRDVGDALSRHATFARVTELFRTDTTVSWWAGSARFRGEPPPSRLLAWRNLRRVQVDSERIPLSRMGDNITLPDGFLQALSAWFHLSPLTDFATITRDSPAFVWSRPTIALVAVPAGRTLALRALSRARTEVVTALLKHASTTLPENLAAHRPLVDDFSRDMIAAFHALGSRQSA